MWRTKDRQTASRAAPLAPPAPPAAIVANAVTAQRLTLPYLDGLRAVAATYVLLFHAVLGFGGQELTGAWRALRRAFAYGHEAVAIFIVLSGYCLMLPVLQRDPHKLGVPFVAFVRRRALRILPPYFVALALSVVLMATIPVLRIRDSGTIWDNSSPGLELGPILSHALLVHNWVPAWAVQLNGPLWSVATEWQIYFAFPLLLLPCWRRAGMLGALLAALVVGYAALLLAPAAAASAGSWYLLLFAFGMSAASLAFQAPGARLATLPWGVICGLAWLGCVAFSNLRAELWFSMKPLTDVLVGFATATTLVHLTSRSRRPGAPRGPLLGLLESRGLVALGHFSYSLYLTHLPVVALCFFALRPLGLAPGAFSLVLAGTSTLASLLFAYGFHLACERPFMLRR